MGLPGAGLLSGCPGKGLVQDPGAVLPFVTFGGLPRTTCTTLRPKAFQLLMQALSLFGAMPASSDAGGRATRL